MARIAIIESLSDTSPYKNYLLANVNLQWAFARLKFNEYFTAAIEINRAYNLIEKNEQEFPDFYPNKITHGVIKIMFGLVPENYNWILSIISKEGSVEGGMNEIYEMLYLSELDTNFAYLKGETIFYLGFIELNIYPDNTKSLILLEEILPLADSSLLFAYMGVNILTKTGQNEKAEMLFLKIQDREGYFPFYYLDYLNAEFYLKKLDTQNARKFYSKFLRNFKGKNYIKDAWRKMAWTYLMEGNSELYKHILSNVGTQGYKDSERDEDAFMEYESSEIPNIDLLKARILFDGNYFTQADSILNHINETNFNFDQKLEKTYRLARLEHKLNNIQEAKKLYKSVVINSELTEKYFPANSALKLGEIYEIEDSLYMAKYYYEKCTAMNFIQYEKSIKAKANEAKRRVSK